MLRMLRVRILLGVAAVLAALAFAGHGLHTTEGLVSVAKYEPVLSSAQFRAPITNLEAQLFAPAPLSLEQRVRLAASVDEMREALLAGSDSHMARFSARELGTLAAMCRGPGSLGGAELARVRQNWMRIRSNLFDDASWFRFSEADPIAPAEEPRIELSERDRWVVKARFGCGGSCFRFLHLFLQVGAQLTAVFSQSEVVLKLLGSRQNRRASVIFFRDQLTIDEFFNMFVGAGTTHADNLRLHDRLLDAYC